MKSKKIIISVSLTLLCLISAQAQQVLSTSQELPNILWLTSEDNSPMLGCYGDEMATTPNLDQMAKDGFMYTHAYANAPVCAPSRNTIITGVYASSAGNDGMRSYYKKSDVIRLLPEYLKSKGYYCTNNSKQDYNFADAGKAMWDESSDTAHYKHRKAGQPFFAIFNTLISHESCLHTKAAALPTRHDPAKVKLPPYQPDTKEIRHDWARYYDCLEDMDAWIGEKLKELDDAGLAENTIVIYYGDHGGVLPRSKRYVYETGTRIPFIVRIPKKFKKLYPELAPGTKVDRLIGLVDLVPTMLSLTNQTIPSYLQGKAFLGAKKTPDPQYAYMFRGRMDERIDMSRAVRDQRFRYIRNYMPYRIYAQHIAYLWNAASMRSWEQTCLAGNCNEVQSRFFRTKPVEELYDTENDPWEVNNLAGNPTYKDVLARMRSENNRWMKEIHDAGFIPEGKLSEISDHIAVYDYMRSGAQSMDELIAISDLANFARKKDVPKLIGQLANKNELIRYWATCGLLQLGKDGRKGIPALKNALTDACEDVAITAAEALYNLGVEDESREVLVKALKNNNIMVQVHALNVIDNSCKQDAELLRAVRELSVLPAAGKSEYLSNLTKWILTKPRI